MQLVITDAVNRAKIRGHQVTWFECLNDADTIGPARALRVFAMSFFVLDMTCLFEQKREEKRKATSLDADGPAWRQDPPASVIPESSEVNLKPR